MEKQTKILPKKHIIIAFILFTVGIAFAVLVCIYRYQTKIKLSDDEARFVIEYFEMEPQAFSSNVPFQTVQYVPTDETYEMVQLLTYYTLYYRLMDHPYQRSIRREIRTVIYEARELTKSNENEIFNVQWLTQNPRGAYHIAKNISKKFDHIQNYNLGGLNIRQIAYCCVFYGIATEMDGKGFLDIDSLHDRETYAHDYSPAYINLCDLIWEDNKAIRPESRAKAQDLLRKCNLDDYEVYEDYYSLPSEFVTDHPYEAFHFMLDLPLDIRTQHHEYLKELYKDRHDREWILTTIIYNDFMYEEEYKIPFSDYNKPLDYYD